MAVSLFPGELDQLEELIQKHSVHVLYFMHYFGALQPEETRRRIAEWKETYGLTVIEDTTHSLFTAKKTVGDYCIASLRKWFPIPDGGVLYMDMEQRAVFMGGNAGQKPKEGLKQKPVSGKVQAHSFLIPQALQPGPQQRGVVSAPFAHGSHRKMRKQKPGQYGDSIDAFLDVQGLLFFCKHFPVSGIAVKALR